MSRLVTWGWIIVGAISLWGVQHGFAIDQLETTAAAIYFSGAALFLNWLFGKVEK
jgi:hypothetical protein